MAQSPLNIAQKAIILHTLGFQVNPTFALLWDHGAEAL